MLRDPEFAGVLGWLYNNLDHNNTLTAREECRYLELEKEGLLLSPEDLETAILDIQHQYEGICLPGDKEAVEDVKLDIHMMKERLSMLEKQEAVFEALKKQNELLNEGLDLEITKLNSAHQQFVEDESAAADECMTLAQEVESLTEGVVDVIADTLDVYSTCHVDKEHARKFLTFGPFESYIQSQALFRSQFDLFVSKKITKVQSDEEPRSVLDEANQMEKRLTDAAWAYINSKAELSGVRAQLAFVTNYKDVHPSQITTCLLEAQSAVELLKQQESILYQELHLSVKQFVDSRTALVGKTTASCALAVRQQVQSALCSALEACEGALRLDRVLYTALRHELCTVEQFLHFAHQFKHYVQDEGDAVRSRIDAMNKICAEQTACEVKINASDSLLQALHVILSGQTGSDTQLLVKQYSELLNDVNDLKASVNVEYKNKEKALVDFNARTQPLRSCAFGGSTRQARRGCPRAAQLAHELTQRRRDANSRLAGASIQLAAAKNTDVHHLRKLWQWFLTDPAKLLSTLKNANCKFNDSQRD